MRIAKQDIYSAEIKVNIIEPDKRNNPNFLAIVSVDFGNFFVRGYRVWQTKDTNKVFVAAPSFRCGGGGWLESFVIKEKILWQTLQKRILQEYEMALMNWSVRNANVAEA